MNRVDRINSVILFIVFFLTFVGYYVILLLLFSTGQHEASRGITIPLRIALGLLLVVYLVRNRSARNQLDSSILLFLFGFSVMYLLRLLIDFNNVKSYYISPSEVFVYFVSFSLLPVVCLSIPRLTQLGLDAIFRSILYGGVIFGVLFIFSYQQFIGSLGRLATGTAGESVISPLAVSYTSTLVIGVLLFYLMTHKLNLYKRMFIVITIGVCVVPFFLGASRGSLVALFFPFMLFFIARRSVTILFAATVVLFVIYYLAEVFDSGLIERFVGISDAIEAGDSSASRIVIWRASIEQFLNSPLIGDQLAVKGWRSYPHNLFIEALQTTGILGFVPFFLLVVKGFKSCYYILKHHSTYGWVATIFLQAVTQHMFSGALYTASWFWTSMGLLFATEVFLKQRGHELEAPQHRAYPQ